jgi:hypothetical protein
MDTETDISAQLRTGDWISTAFAVLLDTRSVCACMDRTIAQSVVQKGKREKKKVRK